MASCAQTVAASTNIAIGVALWLVSGASVYTGCLGPEDVGYLRCAGAVCFPAATVHLYIGSKKTCLVSCFHLLAVSTFTMSTLCLLWYGCMLVARPSMLNINMNLLLLLLLEMLVVVHLLLVVRARQRCCPGAISKSYTLESQGAAWEGDTFPVRAVRLCATLEVVGGVFALFGGVMALTLQPWSAHSASLQACLWTLIAGFPAAVAGHVASEHPSMPLVEVLLALSGLTSPVTAAAAGYLSVSLPRSISLFSQPQSSVKVIDILMVAIMVALLINSILTLITTFICVNHKTLALLPTRPPCAAPGPPATGGGLNNHAQRDAPPPVAFPDYHDRGRAQPPPASPAQQQHHHHHRLQECHTASAERAAGGRAGPANDGRSSMPREPPARHGPSDSSPSPAHAPRPSPGQARRAEQRRPPAQQQHRPPAAPGTPDRGRPLYVTVGSSHGKPLSSLACKPPPPRKASSSELTPPAQGPPPGKRSPASQTAAAGAGKPCPAPPCGFKPPVFSPLASPGGRGKHPMLSAAAKPVLLPLPPPRDGHGDARAAAGKDTKIKRLREKFVDNI